MILVCAATSVEYDACAAGIAASATGANRFEMLRVGVGRANAGRALDDRLARGNVPSLVVSAGFAGALGDDVALGAWVTAARVYKWTREEAVFVADAVPLANEPAMITCDIVSVDSLAGASSSVKRFVSRADAARNAAIVDMESAALASSAKARGVAFSLARVISDTPSDPLPEFLSPFTYAMAQTSTSSRALSIARGLGGALRDPKGVARVVTEGRKWAKDLERGWARIAATLVAP